MAVREANERNRRAVLPGFSRQCAAVTVVTAVVVLAVVVVPVEGHLPFYEGQRMRNGNWNRTDGFAAPTPEEDWSFEHPFDVFNASADVPLLPGAVPSIRPNASVSAEGVLRSANDYDVLLLNKTFAGPLPIVAYPSVPACLRYLNFLPAISIVCPTTVKDIQTGAQVCPTLPAANAFTLPFSIPPGFGIRTVQQLPPADGAQPIRRPAYQDAQTSNVWLEPYNWTVGCVDASNFSSADCTTRYRTFAVYNWVEDLAPYFLVVWLSPQSQLKARNVRSCEWRDNIDVSIIVGIVDQFTTADFVRLDVLQPFIAHGATVFADCVPIPNELVDMHGEI